LQVITFHSSKKLAGLVDLKQKEMNFTGLIGQTVRGQKFLLEIIIKWLI